MGGCASSKPVDKNHQPDEKQKNAPNPSSPPEPETLSRLKEQRNEVNILSKESFQEEIPVELVNGNSLTLPFFRLPSEQSQIVPSETILKFLQILELRKDEPHKTSHRSLYGHVKVCRLMMEGLKMELMAQEKPFHLESDALNPYRPDLVFRWRRRERDLIVICEVQLPNDRQKPGMNGNQLGIRTFGKLSHGLQLLGEEFCLGIGFVQKKNEKQLVAVEACGKYGKDLMKLVEKYGRRWHILVAHSTNE